MQARLDQGPAIFRPLSAAKQAELRQDIAWLAQQSGIGSDAQWHEFASQLLRYYEHLSRWLSPEAQHPFTQALAQTTHQASQRQFTPLAASEGEGIWQQTIQSIVLNRRDDAHAISALLRERKFTDGIWRDVQSGALNPIYEIGPLPGSKLKELTDTMLMPHGGAMEPAAHIHMTALGHQLGHEALAQAFAPSSHAAALMRQSAATALPDVPPARCQLFADHWMRVRATRAQQVADAYAPAGTLVQQAIATSEHNRQSKGARVMATAPAAPAREGELPSDSSWHLGDWLQSIIAKGPRLIGIGSNEAQEDKGRSL